MTSFGWKRKLGASVSKDAAKKFDSDDVNESDNIVRNSASDWATKFKYRKASLDDNCEQKSKRLKAEGITFAENRRYQEAVEKWEKAINLTPNDAKLHEMKAQSLMQLNKGFPAVQAAEMAVQCDPTWWVAYQTLGRAQLDIGEIEMAIVNFCKALHINPTVEELWEEDLHWSLKLLREQKAVKDTSKSHQEKAAEEASKLEFDEDGFIKKNET